MDKCILCTKTGESRKLFLEDKALCDTHYAAYLEFLIEGMDAEVDTDSMNDAHSQLAISLEPKPSRLVIKMEEEVKDTIEPVPYASPFRMGM